MVVREKNCYYAIALTDFFVFLSCAENLFKLVRAKHVKTDVHWSKTWRPAQLIDYEKYHWQTWQFRSI